MQVGDTIVAGAAYGKIRAMTDDKGRRVKKAGPSTPVEILGLSEVPSACDSFYVAENDKQARQVAESIIAKNRENMIKETPQKVSLDDLFSQIQSGNMKELNIVVKADVQGSVEAVRQSLERLSNEEVRVRKMCIRDRANFLWTVQASNRAGAHIFAPIRNAWQRRRSPKVWNAPSRHLCPRTYMKPCWHSWKEKKIMRKFYSLLGLCKRANKVAGGEVDVYKRQHIFRNNPLPKDF